MSPSAAAKADLVLGAFVCRNRQGSWIAVSSDQFGEQTAIKIGKDGQGITLDQEMVTERRSAFPIGAYICDTVDLLYKEDQPNGKEVLHKEEGLSRRRLDADDRRWVANELSKHPHPQEGQGEDHVLYKQWQNWSACSEIGRCGVNRGPASCVVPLLVTVWQR